MKLTIELVPSTSWFNNVRSAVSRKRWDELRRACYEKAGHRCEICGGRGRRHAVEAHEKWEYDDTNGVQRLVGLIALCPDCHAVKHIGLAEAQGRLDRALRHLCKVNGLDPQEASSYVDEQFLLWQVRSQRDWTVDIAWLERET